MAPIVKNIAAVVVGFIVGGFVNMGLIMLGSSVIPAPPGVDVSDAESIAAGMHLFEAKHFITPFVAHAAGTLVGALVAYLLAASSKMTMAMIIGFVTHGRRHSRSIHDSFTCLVHRARPAGCLYPDGLAWRQTRPTVQQQS